MTIPDWWQATLLALAALRLWKLLGEDEILNRPRDWILEKSPAALGTFLACPWCLGFWCSLAVWGAWQTWPHGTLALSAPLAISAAVGIVGAKAS